MTNELSKNEIRSYIEKLDANNRESKAKSDPIEEWDESVSPPKRPDFIQEIFDDIELIQDEAEKRMANFFIKDGVEMDHD